MSNLTGVTVLIVEDDYLVAKWLELELTGYGCEVIGPVPTTTLALAALNESAVDLAILDVQLAEETSEPVARAMLAQDLRFVFLTGFSDLGILPEDLHDCRILQKPLDSERVRQTLGELLKT